MESPMIKYKVLYEGRILSLSLSLSLSLYKNGLFNHRSINFSEF